MTARGVIPPALRARLHVAVNSVDDAADELRAAVRAAWLAGGSVRAIATELGKSTRTIQDWLEGFISAPCGHRGCQISPTEQRAHAAVTTMLDDPDLIRVCDAAEPPGTAIPDFSSARHVIEVKELTSQQVRQFAAACDKHMPQRYVPVTDLRHLWAVSADVSAAAGEYAGRSATPKAKTMLDSITDLVRQLEARGVDDAFADAEIWERVAKVLGFYGHCAVLGGTSLEPGILFTGTVSGQARTLDLELDVVAVLQCWLDSEQSRNARESLAGRDGAHVLALVPHRDGPASSMLQTLGDTRGEIPTTALQLPHDIDVLIVVTDAEVLCFTAADGWSRRPLPAQ
ncbi:MULTISPECIES: helix-turn-helix domain-containing protein [Mycolicibacterium]|uniref:helix-turn-helix domain-containing protein n=1 Tax=Mycolicibacterium TaxID=1866885 RepID=UPI001CDC5CD8|nr:helix-turn-helix domain-containing protein [Mycolicibacterium fortuitum]UBV20314.1 hypothetical protein H8Z59_24025 [Mycolicibacterium fortuitum]